MVDKQLTCAQSAMRKAIEIRDTLQDRDDSLQHKAHEVAEYLRDHLHNVTDQ